MTLVMSNWPLSARRYDSASTNAKVYCTAYGAAHLRGNLEGCDMTWQMDRDDCTRRCDENRTHMRDFYDGFLTAMQIFLREGRGILPRQAHISSEIGMNCFPSIGMEGDLSDLGPGRARLDLNGKRESPASLQRFPDISMTSYPEANVRNVDARLAPLLRRLGTVLSNEGVDSFLVAVGGELKNHSPSEQEALAGALNRALPKPQFACDGTPDVNFRARSDGGMDVTVTRGGWGPATTEQYRITQNGRLFRRR